MRRHRQGWSRTEEWALWPVLLAFIALAAVAAAPEGLASDEEAIAFPERMELAEATRVPLLRASTRPQVAVTIDGEGPFRLLFDTGAVGLMVDRSLADRLALPAAGKGIVRSPLTEGFEVSRVRIARLEVGAVTLFGVVADRWDGPPLFSEADPPQGVIGPSLFHDALVTLDLTAGVLGLEKGALSRDDPGVVPFEDDHGLPLFTIDVAGVTVPAHLDTGNSSALILPLEAGVPLKEAPVVAGRARLVDAEVTVYAATVTGTVRLGDWRLEEPDVRLLPGATAANLGVGLLGRVVVTLDQRAGLARIRLAGK